MLWLPCLLLAAILGTRIALPWQLATLALAAANYAVLVANLRAGRNIADRVTIVRFVLLVAAAALATVEAALDTTVWLLLGLALAGDALDGWCARRFGATEAGAILDMETDQFAFLVVSLTAVVVAASPWPLLVLPALRLVKLAAHAVARVDAHSPRPRSGDNREARTLCALATALLWLTLAPGTPTAWPWVTASTAAALLVYSFRVDFRELFDRA